MQQIFIDPVRLVLISVLSVLSYSCGGSASGENPASSSSIPDQALVGLANSSIPSTDDNKFWNCIRRGSFDRRGEIVGYHFPGTGTGFEVGFTDNSVIPASGFTIQQSTASSVSLSTGVILSDIEFFSSDVSLEKSMFVTHSDLGSLDCREDLLIAEGSSDAWTLLFNREFDCEADDQGRAVPYQLSFVRRDRDGFLSRLDSSDANSLNFAVEVMRSTDTSVTMLLDDIAVVEFNRDYTASLFDIEFGDENVGSFTARLNATSPVDGNGVAISPPFPENGSDIACEAQ